MAPKPEHCLVGAGKYSLDLAESTAEPEIFSEPDRSGVFDPNLSITFQILRDIGVTLGAAKTIALPFM